jgi:hypothetical protein
VPVKEGTQARFGTQIKSGDNWEAYSSENIDKSSLDSNSMTPARAGVPKHFRGSYLQQQGTNNSITTSRSRVAFNKQWCLQQTDIIKSRDNKEANSTKNIDSNACNSGCLKHKGFKRMPATLTMAGTLCTPTAAGALTTKGTRASS